MQGIAEQGRYADIICGDELLWHLAQHRILAGFVTGECAWPPTFKRVKGSRDGYNLKRVPSYCDRVLFKSLPGLESDLTLIEYEACDDFISSDHKPVRAQFVMKAIPDIETSLFGALLSCRRCRRRCRRCHLRHLRHHRRRQTIHSDGIIPYLLE